MRSSCRAEVSETSQGTSAQGAMLRGTAPYSNPAFEREGHGEMGQGNRYPGADSDPVHTAGSDQSGWYTTMHLFIYIAPFIRHVVEGSGSIEIKASWGEIHLVILLGNVPLFELLHSCGRLLELLNWSLVG